MQEFLKGKIAAALDIIRAVAMGDPAIEKAADIIEDAAETADSGAAPESNDVVPQHSGQVAPEPAAGDNLEPERVEIPAWLHDGGEAMVKTANGYKYAKIYIRGDGRLEFAGEHFTTFFDSLADATEAAAQHLLIEWDGDIELVDALKKETEIQKPAGVEAFTVMALKMMSAGALGRILGVTLRDADAASDGKYTAAYCKAVSHMFGVTVDAAGLLRREVVARNITTLEDFTKLALELMKACKLATLLGVCNDAAYKAASGKFTPAYCEAVSRMFGIDAEAETEADNGD